MSLLIYSTNSVTHMSVRLSVRVCVCLFPYSSKTTGSFGPKFGTIMHLAPADVLRGVL